MKIKLLNTKLLLSILFTCFFCIIDYVSYTYGNSTPPSSLTNAPNEGNCTSCHGGSGLVTSGNQWNNVTLTANAQSTLTYYPDSVFKMVLTADISGITKYGFEITALDSATNKAIGTFTITNSSTTSKGTNNVAGFSREYVYHTSGGVSAQNGNAITWGFNWKAPSTKTSTIKFYAVVNATNSNGSDNGDVIYAKVFTMRLSTLLPTAKATVSNNTLCTGDTLFCNSSGNNVTQRKWTIYNGASVVATDTSTNPYFVMNTAGTFKVKLVNSNNKGAAADSQTVKVNQGPTVSIAPTGTTKICSTDSVKLTATATSGSSLLWSDGSTTSIIYVKKSGTYYVDASLNGCSKKSNSVDIEVASKLPAPSLNCGNSTLNSITYTWLSLTGAVGYEVSEDHGTSWIKPSSGSKGLSHTRNSLNSNTNYTLHVRATDTVPCNIGEEDSITCITMNCSAIQYAVSFDSLLCAGVNDTIRFKIQSTSKYSIKNNNIYSNQTEYIVNANVDSIYNFEIIDSNQLACASTKLGILVKRSAVSGTFASIKGQGACEGVVQVFEASSGFAKYIFKDKQGNILQDSSISVYSTNKKSIILSGIDITISNDLGCTENIAAMGGTVYTIPVASFSAAKQSGSGSIQFTTTSAVSVKSNWDFGDGSLDTTNKKVITHVYNAGGKFNVKLTEISNGCIDDTLMEVDAGNVGLNTIHPLKEWNVYPNPFSEELTIDLSALNSKVISIELVDIQGQLKNYFTENQISGNSLIKVATEHLSSGVYVLKFRTSDGQQQCIKVLKY